MNSQYVTFKLPTGHWMALLFTQTSEEDTWICQMTNETMQDLQKVIGDNLYESL